MLEKKGKDKRFINNWRPISLINFDAKLLAKCLAKRMKEVLPKIIKYDQTAYIANRFIGESVRLISDILDVTKTLNIDGYLMTVDIEKAFDSVDHTFLYACLEKFGFDKSINHIHLIFRIAVYNSRSVSAFNVQYILNKINNTKKIEENLSFSNQNSRDKYNEKWSNYKVLPTIDDTGYLVHFGKKSPEILGFFLPL